MPRLERIAAQCPPSALRRESPFRRPSTPRPPALPAAREAPAAAAGMQVAQRGQTRHTSA